MPASLPSSLPTSRRSGHQSKRCQQQGSETALPAFLPAPSEEGVRRFQELYLSRFGQTLNDDEALDLATRYLHLYFFGTTRPNSKTSLGLEQSALSPGSFVSDHPG